MSAKLLGLIGAILVGLGVWALLDYNGHRLRAKAVGDSGHERTALWAMLAALGLIGVGTFVMLLGALAPS